VAPGRVNLIGEHTDYNDGLALPVAIDLRTSVRFEPSRSPTLHLTTAIDDAPARIPVRPVPAPAAIAAFTPAWARMAAAMVMIARPAFGGSARITSTVAPGAGLASSAALCVALALALGVAGDPLAIAELCRLAEAAAGSEVGLMDPLTSMAGRSGAALLIDFGTRAWEPVALPAGAELVVVHSGVARTLAGSGYPARRAECEAATRALGIPLGRAALSDLVSLGDPVLRRRVRHVVTECVRVRTMAAALEAGDLTRAGEAMAESHRSLAEDFEASTPEVDDLVRVLAATPGVHGARLTGGGFGGCVVVLADPGAVDLDRWPGRATRVVPSPGASAGPADRPAPPD
jgi:galactokinase